MTLLTYAVKAMLHITLSGSPQRHVELRSVNTATHVLGSVISTMSIPDHSHSHTSSDNALAYRPILLTTAQPLSLSIWKLLFHAIVITKLLLSAICLPPTTFNKESHLSKQPILVTTTKYLATARALQHMDLESWVALNLIQFASQILMQVWCVCYLQHVASHLPKSQLGDAIIMQF